MSVPIGAIGLGWRDARIVGVVLVGGVLNEPQCQLLIVLFERRIVAGARKRHTNPCLTPRITA